MDDFLVSCYCFSNAMITKKRTQVLPRLTRPGRGLSWLLSVAVLMGCAGGDDSFGARSSAIVGGVEDAADPEVFMLDFRSVVGTINMCSATLVSRRTLLTAGHCLDPKVTPSFLPLRATNKTRARSAPDSDFIEVVGTLLHPDYSALQSANGHDIALALLASAPEGVTPKPMNKAPLDDYVGEPVQVLGYGYTADGDYTSWGTKMTVDLTILKLDPLQFTVSDDRGTKGICNGDSGGPAFLTFPDGVERVVGVHSTTKTEYCLGSVDVRVDQHIDFINTGIATLESPDGGVTADAGGVTDGALDAGADAGTGQDDGALPDASEDVPDAGAGEDTGEDADAGSQADAGVTGDSDAGGVSDAAASGGKTPTPTQGADAEAGGCGCATLGLQSPEVPAYIESISAL